MVEGGFVQSPSKMFSTSELLTSKNSSSPQTSQKAADGLSG